MIRKLLIANRGEIACRIIATCRRLGIGSVAVFSDADAGALHVRAADEAVRIGPAEAASSYLDADAILRAALLSGADSIHPGYGFLSERTVLPRLCAANNLVWVGPSADAIERMGSKVEAKRIAEAAGVPVVPGARTEQDDASLIAAAEAIGFPVLIKASAGGGGRGMRRVERSADLAEALQMARREAQAGFGDPTLLIEKLIQRPRHLEVQLAGDKHGGLVHLFERECSIQRNYQKLVEEAPAPRLTDRTRAALHDAALRLGRAIGYDSLGTAEFILEDGEEQPYFLEMNTRLQVEHPVTELITGIDLVEWQIRAASGEHLPLTQNEIHATGSAIEVRVNAEDPAEGYRPQLGVVTGFRIPDGEGIRVDTGISVGSEISPHYDSLVAKVIAYGADRALAVQRLGAALDGLAISGVGSNQAFLRDIVRQPAFVEGRLTTRFLEEVFPNGWAAPATATDAERVAAAAIWADGARETEAALGPWVRLGAFRVLERAGRAGMVRVAVEGGGAEAVLLVGGGKVRLGDTSFAVSIRRAGPGAAVMIDGVIHNYIVARDSDMIELSSAGRTTRWHVRPEIDGAGSAAADAGAGGPLVVAAMPGLINAVDVKVGQRVAQGDTVIVMEAMKLMMRLPAPVSGTVKEILCAPGQTVAAGAVLLEIEPSS